jgi:hypothetical protein
MSGPYESTGRVKSVTEFLDHEEMGVREFVRKICHGYAEDEFLRRFSVSLSCTQNGKTPETTTFKARFGCKNQAIMRFGRRVAPFSTIGGSN